MTKGISFKLMALISVWAANGRSINPALAVSVNREAYLLYLIKPTWGDKLLVMTWQLQAREVAPGLLSLPSRVGCWVSSQDIYIQADKKSAPAIIPSSDLFTLLGQICVTSHFFSFSFFNVYLL